MPVNSLHPEYEDFEPDWELIRDLMKGERKMKEQGEKYIEKLPDMTNEEWDAHIQRGSLFNATARTVNGMTGMIFMKDPLITMGSDNDARGAIWEEFQNDVDLQGTWIGDYASEVVEEVIAMGRCGTLIDYSTEEGRPYLVFYKAEDILNWRVERVDGRMIPTMITVREFVEKEVDGSRGATRFDEFDTAQVEQIRKLSLDLSSGVPIYTVEVYQEMSVDKDNVTQTKDQQRRNKGDKKKVWTVVEGPLTPTRMGEPLNEIPFIFHGVKSTKACAEKPPILDLAFKNLEHYRKVNQLNYGLWYASMPTPVVVGADTDAGGDFKIGSRIAWILNEGGDAKFLEFSGQGLEPMRQAIEDCKADMTVLGARLLESQKREAESAEALEIRSSGEGSILAKVANTSSNGLTRILEWVLFWVGAVDDLNASQDGIADFELNKNFINRRMTGDEAMKLVGLWQSSAISKETLFDNLKRGEIIAQDQEYDDEEREIEDGQDKLLGVLKGDDGGDGGGDDEDTGETNP